MQCGIIFDKPSEIGSITHPRFLTEDYIANTKERLLTAMLHDEVRENEDKWIIYDDEYTEVIYIACSPHANSLTHPFHRRSK